MDIYATGVTGTIGRHLTAGVKALKIQLGQPNLELSSSGFSPGDSLIHLAGIVGSTVVDQDLTTSHQVNVAATEKLAIEFLSRRGGRFIFVSSSHVYENSEVPIMETNEVNPKSNYAKQKLEAEDLLLKMFISHPERLCIARVFSVLDWDVAPFTLGGAISKLTDPDSDFVLRYSNDKRDFLTPKSIAEALTQISMKSSLFGIVNVCSGLGISVREAAEKMLTESGYQVPFHRIESGNSGNSIIVGDNSRLRSQLPKLDLNWTPTSHTKKW